MSESAANLLAEALRLSDAERGEFAPRLIESLDPRVDDGVEAAWGAEIQSRLEELQSAKVQPVPWPEPRRMILEETDAADED